MAATLQKSVDTRSHLPDYIYTTQTQYTAAGVAEEQPSRLVASQMYHTYMNGKGQNQKRRRRQNDETA